MISLAHAEHMLFIARYGMGMPYRYEDIVYWEGIIKQLKEKE